MPTVQRPASAKWCPRGVLMLTAALCFGCARATPSAAAPVRGHWAPGYVFGMWGKAEFDARDDCPTTGPDTVRIGASWSTLLVSVLTLGMYTPREVRIQCKAP